MLDWIQYVKARLGTLPLDGDEPQEVIEELATHLQEMYVSLRAKGASEAEALRLTRAQVESWEKLRDEIVYARQEGSMEDRVGQLWVPGLVTLLGSAGLLVVLEIMGARPLVIHPGDPAAIVLDLPWLLGLPAFGALGAFLAQRAKAKGLAIHLSSVFPPVVMAAAMIAVFIGGLIFDRQVLSVFKTRAFSAAVVNGVLLPGMALLIGDLVFQWINKKRGATG